jgi:DNA-binding winged helix-turn-helix (wHTH) protein
MTSSTRSSGYWTGFPSTYRAEEIATIMHWLAAGESGVIVGGSGSGKSNLLGFLSSQPEAITPYIAGTPDKYCFLLLDINSLPLLTVPYFYRGMIQTLEEVAGQFGAEIEQAIQQLTQSQIEWDDTFRVLTLLNKTHRLLIYQMGKRVVWLLDRFDEACQRLDAQLFNSLRSLRDQFKGQLCYVVATRHPLAQLRDLSEIDEFYEIVAANICWVGPMVDRDARWIARQMADRLQTNFSGSEVSQLIEITGGLPAFMKAACLALADDAIAEGEPSAVWAEHLLARREFRRNCQEMWDDLSPEERMTLAAINSDGEHQSLDAGALIRLEQMGVLTRPASSQLWQIFPPIFAHFIAQQHQEATGSISLHPQTRAVLRGGTPLNVELTANEDRLLSYFLEHAGEICPKDVLMHAVWPDEEMIKGVRDDRLAQLVRRLREKIEPDAAHPVYIQTVRGRGYRFVQPGAGQGKTA